MKPLVPYFLQEEFLRKIRAAPSSSNEFRVSRNVIIKVTFVFVLSVYYLSWIFLHLRWRTTRLDRSEVNRPQRLTYPWLCRWEILLFVSESERERVSDPNYFAGRATIKFLNWRLSLTLFGHRYHLWITGDIYKHPSSLQRRGPGMTEIFLC